MTQESTGTIARFPWVVLVAAMMATVASAQGATQSRAGISAFSARKAELLLRDALPCLGCHALRGDGGRVGPDLTTVRERRSAAYIAAIIDEPQRVVPGSAMPRPLLTQATRELVARYLASLPGSADSSPIPTAPSVPQAGSTPTDGAVLYARWCAACHGTGGAGNGPNARFLPVPPTAHSTAAVMEQRSDDALYDTVAGGGAIMNRSPRMPAFGGSLTPAEIRALVTHLRVLCKCQGPAWSRDARVVR